MSTAAPAMPLIKLLTAEEFARKSEPFDGSQEELVRGVIIKMPPPGFQHGKHQGRIFALLDAFVRLRHLGQVVVETGVITEREPDSVRGPDVSFWSVDRLPLDELPRAYPLQAADLCVEVLSSSDRRSRMKQKLREYFACGVRTVWIVDSEARTATVYRQPDQGRLLDEADTISGEDVIPGFTCRVVEFFE